MFRNLFIIGLIAVASAHHSHESHEEGFTINDAFQWFIADEFDGVEECWNETKAEVRASNTSKAFVFCLGEANMDKVNDIAADFNATAEDVGLYVTGAFDAMVWGQCDIGQVTKDAGCIFPASHNPRVGLKFAECALKAFEDMKDGDHCFIGQHVFEAFAASGIKHFHDIMAEGTGAGSLESVESQEGEEDLTHHFIGYIAEEFGLEECVKPCMDKYKDVKDFNTTRPFVQCVGQCSPEKVAEIVAEFNLTDGKALEDHITRAFDAIFVHGCDIGEITDHAECEFPQSEDDKEICRFAVCAAHAFHHIPPVDKCAGGAPVFGAYAYRHIVKHCHPPHDSEEHDGFTLDDAFRYFIADEFEGVGECWEEWGPKLESSNTTKGFVYCIGEANLDKVNDIAADFNATAEDVGLYVIGAFDAMIYGDCDIGKVTEEAGCVFPETHDPEEGLKFAKCALEAFQDLEEGDACFVGQHVFEAFAEYGIEHFQHAKKGHESLKSLESHEEAGDLTHHFLEYMADEFGAEECVKPCLEKYADVENITTTRPFVQCVGNCSAEQVAAIVAEFNLTDAKELENYVTAAFDSIVVLGCDIGAITHHAECKFPQSEDDKEICDFAVCAAHAFHHIPPLDKCAGGAPVFGAYAHRHIVKHCPEVGKYY